MENVKNDLLNDIDEVISKKEINQRHSYFQLKYFLVGKEPTMQSKMWQCLRELKNRSESLKSIDLETEELKDKLELLDINVQKVKRDRENNQSEDKVLHDLFLKECDIKIRQLDRQKKALEQSCKYIQERKRWISEESRFFLETFRNLEKIEPLRHFDDLEAQKEYWQEKLTQKVNLKMLTQNTIDVDLIETIVALPDELKIKQQTLQTLNLKQNEILMKLAETAKKLESKHLKEN